MQRQPHQLTDNKSTFRPRLHIFVDAEAELDDPRGGWQDHHFRTGWALFWRRRQPPRADQLEWYRIDNPSDFWAWVDRHTRSKTRLVLVSHNLDYDLVLLKAFSCLATLGWDLHRFYLERDCKILAWKKGRKTILAVDNVNYFKGALREWGQAVGLPKLDVNPLEANLGDLTTYCRRDVQILHDLWQWWYRYIDDHECGAWGVTLAGQAFHAFRHRFMRHGVWIHNGEEALELERASYHGGRTECFRVGEYDSSIYYKLDVNSMYPFIMWAFPVPLDLRGYSDKFSYKALKYRLERYSVIARVIVNCREPYFPHVTDDGLIYPVGAFETVLTTPELRVALERGWIEQIKEGAWYRRGLLFREYVDYWYPLKLKYRQENQPLQYQLTKLMLNSLYGKFGQLQRTLTAVGSCHPDDFGITRVWDSKQHRWGTEYRLAGQVFLSETGGETYHSFPAIASHITAYARIYLYRIIQIIGSDHVYYCDTDSVIIDSQGFEKVAPYLRPAMLGHLKVERIARYLALHAPKDYQMDGQVILKGVRSNALWLSEDTIEQDVFPSIRGLLRAGKTDTYATRRQIKRLERVIRSGVRFPDGHIEPWELDLESEGAIPL